MQIEATGTRAVDSTDNNKKNDWLQQLGELMERYRNRQRNRAQTSSRIHDLRMKEIRTGELTPAERSEYERLHREYLQPHKDLLRSSPELFEINQRREQLRSLIVNNLR